uniref:Uncharacterized protein n=1 Tax=Myoviridae sp. ctIty1 TaxID=2827673 RepID=A0A8S5THP5_9CAUD|nr:MAG TPA: hypothetical protein [Myoviridae sp. ctIty1]
MDCQLLPCFISSFLRKSHLCINCVFLKMAKNLIKFN